MPPAPESWSLDGARLSARSGIGELMDDLGHALAAVPPGGKAPAMLGGGNPAHIPAMEEVWQRRLQEITSDPDARRRLLAVYDPPRGNQATIRALADLLRNELGWPVGPENIAVTPGGQTAFFLLFLLFGGPHADGSRGRILLPLAPEYIGYANQPLHEGTLLAQRPLISKPADHFFKYHIDFDNLRPPSDTAAICVSRPTNPSGNVITDAEMERLDRLAAERGVPLIIDNAYGLPFPGILFADATPLWTDRTIHILSLSKVGLPGTRTAFVIGPPEVAEAISSMVSVTGLANPNLGQAITAPLLADGELARLARGVVRPHYLAKRDAALAFIERHFPRHLPYRFHVCEGALFLWLWLEGSRKTSRELYESLKSQGVLVVPGHHFFFGTAPDAAPWPHRDECLRISFAMDPAMVEEGLRIIGREIASAW
jgi:valine--pyruvate aminotransferase